MWSHDLLSLEIYIEMLLSLFLGVYEDHTQFDHFVLILMQTGTKCPSPLSIPQFTPGECSASLKEH